MTRYRWARWGDVNAFFGLMLDNVAVMIVLVVLVTSAEPVAEHRFSREFVLTQMIPGTALGVLLGDLTYTWMALRLARRSGRSDVTAMPLGLDTPSTFAVGGLVLLPALNDGMTRFGLDHHQAMVFGWHVGAMLLVMVGVFKSILAPLGAAGRTAGVPGRNRDRPDRLRALVATHRGRAGRRPPDAGGDLFRPGRPPPFAGQDSRGLGCRVVGRARLLSGRLPGRPVGVARRAAARPP